MNQPDLLQNSRVIVDLDAIAHNIRLLRQKASGAQMLAVVKADAYGHGRAQVARAALAGGATWLGAAQPTEAVALRSEIGDTLPDGAPLRILTWLFTPGSDFTAALAANLDVTVSAPWALDAVCGAVRARGGTPARVHLKIDTGMSRLGERAGHWPELVKAARDTQREGLVEVVGVWSHLACADMPGNPMTQRQNSELIHAAELARAAGLNPMLHLAASAGILWHPETHHDMVRAGIAMYGISPEPRLATGRELGLRPALRWEADLAIVKRVPAGTPISYGSTEQTEQDSWLGVVPVGYADGVPRHASSSGPVRVGQKTTRIMGRVCMDQVIIDLGAADGPEAPAKAGDLAVLIGADGPSAEEWAAAAGTIGYEIVTRLGARIPRSYLPVQDVAAASSVEPVGAPETAGDDQLTPQKKEERP